MSRRHFRRRGRIRQRSAVSHNQKNILLLCAAALAGLLLLYLIFFSGIFRKDDQLVELDVTEQAEISTADGSSIYYLEGSTLHCINSAGGNLWSAKYASGKMHLCAGKRILCLYNDTTATVLDSNKNPLFNVPASDFGIRKVVCGTNALAMDCTMEGSEHSYLRVFDASGVEIDRIEVTASLLDFGFFGESDNLWYMTLDTTGAEPICRIMTTMPTQQKLTGLYEVYGQLVSDVEFLGSDVYVSTTASLLAYDTFGEIFYEEMIYGSELADTLALKDGLIMAYAPAKTASGSYSALRLLSPGGMDTLILLPSGVEHVALSQKNVYCFTKDMVYLYDYQGEFVRSQQLDLEITAFTKLYDGLILLRSEDTSYLFALN